MHFLEVTRGGNTLLAGISKLKMWTEKKNHPSCRPTMRDSAIKLFLISDAKKLSLTKIDRMERFRLAKCLEVEQNVINHMRTLVR